MSRIGVKTSLRWPSTATYAVSASWCEAEMCDTYSPPTRDGVTSRHAPPSSAVTCTRPSSVPAHSTPAFTADSASAVIVPAVSASEPTARILSGSPVDRSSLIFSQRSPRSVSRKTQLPPR